MWWGWSVVSVGGGGQCIICIMWEWAVSSDIITAGARPAAQSRPGLVSSHVPPPVTSARSTPGHSWWPPCSRCGWWRWWTPAGAAWPRWRRLVAGVMWLHQLCCPARSYYSHCTTVPHCTLYHCHCTIHHFGGYFIFNSKAEPQYLLERIL